MEKQRKTAAIICEYNPFHFGHAYLAKTVKRSFDTVLGIMSGAFVQRGGVAVADKYSRAAAAVRGGTDLVVELPFPYCCAAAPDFAAAGVRMAAALGADALAFGCEDDMETLLPVAERLADGSLREKAETLLRGEKSLSLPRAMQKAALTLAGEAAAEALRRPDNILACEYMAEIARSGFALPPFPVRKNAAFPSAAQIRESGSYASGTPFPEYFRQEMLRDIGRVGRLLLYILRSKDDGAFYGVDACFRAVLRKAARDAHSLEEAVASAADKVYTKARVRRAALALWLRIGPAEVKSPPSYALLLAANERGRAFLRDFRKRSDFPVITKPADYVKHPQAKAAFLRALEADEAAALCAPEVPPFGAALKASPAMF